MKAWERRQLDQLCKQIGQKIPTANFSDATPTPLNYGQAGDPGATGLISRSDHRHRLSAAGLIGQVPLTQFDCETKSSSMNTQLKLLNNIFGSNTGLTNDEPGVFGAFGMNGVNFAIGPSGTNYHVALSNANPASAAGDTTTRAHSVQRLQHVHMRCRCRGTASPNSHKAAIGAVHESANADLDTLDDALCFYIERDVASVGNFRALARSSTTGLSTDIDLGFGWTFTSNGEFMTFEILYDLTTAAFYIDGILLAEITDNIPDQQVFGWGLFSEKTAVTPSAREIWIDDIIFLGRS